MTLVLDTHTYLWQSTLPEKLSRPSRLAMEDPSSSLYVSVASLWEIGILVGLKRIELNVSIQKIVEQSIRDAGIQVLPIESPHIDTLASLPFFHRDPFDRMIVAQAKCLGATVVGKDDAFDRYGLERIW